VTLCVPKCARCAAPAPVRCRARQRQTAAGHIRLALANQATGSSARRPTRGLNQIRVARGQIAQNRTCMRGDDPASTRKPISTGLGAHLRTQKSFIQRLRRGFACALLVRRRLRSRWTGVCRDLQRHESQNARVEARRLGLAFEVFVLWRRSQEVETGFCVCRGCSRWI